MRTIIRKSYQRATGELDREAQRSAVPTEKYYFHRRLQLFFLFCFETKDSRFYHGRFAFKFGFSQETKENQAFTYTRYS
jgi:hypothetical protein